MFKPKNYWQFNMGTPFTKNKKVELKKKVCIKKDEQLSIEIKIIQKKKDNIKYTAKEKTTGITSQSYRSIFETLKGLNSELFGFCIDCIKKKEMQNKKLTAKEKKVFDYLKKFYPQLPKFKYD